MRSVSVTASRWVWSLVTGAGYVGVQALTRGWQDPEGWPGWLIGGLVFGAVGGPVFAARQRRLEAAVGPMSVKELWRVRRAAMFGPPPTDPELRQAATRLAVHQLGEVIRYRWSQAVVFGLLLVLMVGIAAVAPQFWLLVALFGVLLATEQVWRPRHLRRRIELLTSEAAL
jgi:hypothetical protein